MAGGVRAGEGDLPGYSIKGDDTMNDRDKDMALLKKFSIDVNSGKILIVTIACATFITVLAILTSAFTGSSILAAITCMPWLTVIAVILQRYFGGPISRELQRLKKEIDSIKKTVGPAAPSGDGPDMHGENDDC